MLLLLLACSGGADKPSDGATDGPTDSSLEAPPEWGLTERPENPDCLAVAPPVDQTASVSLERAWPELSFNQLSGVVPVPGETQRVAVLEQLGPILVIEEGSVEVQVMLDLTDRLAQANEAGLLGLAFHPNFADNGHAYVSYTVRDDADGLVSVVSRFTSSDGGLTLSPESEETLLTLEQTGDNHNGGRLAFHPDGTLLIGFGDGGGSGRKYTAQDPETWFGAFLRIDVDGASPYAIPADNPWADGAAPEVWAIGLRNPWGWDIDPANGELLVGDVGWNAYEEVNLVERGGNYGWVYYEGPECTVAEECPEVGQIEALHSYAHDPGNCVIGGVVYRGEALPELDGDFLFTDLADHALRALRVNEDGEVEVETILADSGLRVAAIGRDGAGEVLLAAFSRTGEGGLYRLVRAGDPPEQDPFPATLSATGCEDGTLPYVVNAPFFSEGADKERWMALPDGEQASVDADGDLVFPVGAVLGKTFSMDGQALETRLLMQREAGVWDGYAYVWDEAGETATLASGAVLLSAGRSGSDYRVPARHECGQCHVSGPLGLSLQQLVGERDYDNGARSEQLATLAHVGAIAPLSEAQLATPALPSSQEDARAWLHVNCAGCHQPEGAPGAGEMDLRYDTPLAETGACEASPQDYDLGIADARLLAPGAPDRSLILQRVLASETLRMPPVGGVDEAGAARLEAWIDALEGCD